MGRGRKSGHDRKEERKEKRADAKNAKFEKSPRKVTKGSLKKEFKAKQAVSESFRSASSISMDRKEENTLLGLIAMLDNVCIEPVHVHFHGKDKVKTFEVERDDQSTEVGVESVTDMSVPGNELQELDSTHDSGEQSGDESSTESAHSDASSTSDSSSDSDSDSDSSSDDDLMAEPASKLQSVEQPATVNAEGKLVIGRQKYIRQLIRGERRYIREQQKASLIAPSAERVVARLKQSLQPNSTLNTTASYGASATSASVTAVHNIGFAYKPAKDRHNNLSASSISTNNVPLKVSKPVLNSSVRVNAHFDKVGEGTGRPGAAKLLVLPRSTSLAEILEMFRVKFKATNTVNSGQSGSSGGKVYKYNAIRVVSSGELLDGFSMLTLPDGEALTLFSSADILRSGGESDRAADSVAAVDPESSPAAAPVSEDTGTTESAEKHTLLEQKNESDESNLTAGVESVLEEPTAIKTTMITPSYWVPPTIPVLNHSTNTSGTNNATDTSTAAYNQRVRATLTAAYQTPAYASIRTSRAALPIFSHKSALLETIQTNPVTVVSGETGSGKTTQLPLYLMEQMIKNNNANKCNIVCTQPRRIAAISVAERVNFECAQPGMCRLNYFVPTDIVCVIREDY